MADQRIRKFRYNSKTGKTELVKEIIVLEKHEPASIPSRPAKKTLAQQMLEEQRAHALMTGSGDFGKED